MISRSGSSGAVSPTTREEQEPIHVADFSQSLLWRQVQDAGAILEHVRMLRGLEHEFMPQFEPRGREQPGQRVEARHDVSLLYARDYRLRGAGPLSEFALGEASANSRVDE